jgi:hypothetical protein
MLDALSEWLDRLQCLVTAGAVPVRSKFGAVELGPFDHESRGSRRELAGYHGEGLDVDRGLVIAVSGVEMRPAGMVDLVVVHRDHDSIEGADPGHQSMIGAAADGAAAEPERRVRYVFPTGRCALQKEVPTESKNRAREQKALQISPS